MCGIFGSDWNLEAPLFRDLLWDLMNNHHLNCPYPCPNLTHLSLMWFLRQSQGVPQEVRLELEQEEYELAYPRAAPTEAVPPSVDISDYVEVHDDLIADTEIVMQQDGTISSFVSMVSEEAPASEEDVAIFYSDESDDDLTLANDVSDFTTFYSDISDVDEDTPNNADLDENNNDGHEI